MTTVTPSKSATEVIVSNDQEIMQLERRNWGKQNENKVGFFFLLFVNPASTRRTSFCSIVVLGRDDPERTCPFRKLV